MDGLKNDDLEQIVPIFAFSSKSYVTDICRLALSNIERFVTSDFYIDRIKHISQLEYLSLIHILNIHDLLIKYILSALVGYVKNVSIQIIVKP